MRTTYARLSYLASFWLFASSVAAQNPAFDSTTTTAAVSPAAAPTIPSCAKLCVQTAASTQSCAPTDQACLCRSSTQIQQSIYQCLKTSNCNEGEKTTAFQYYPAFCNSLNLAVETRLATTTATAGGNVATQLASEEPTSSTNNLSSSASQTESASSNETTDHVGLRLPAILGITLVVVILIVAVTMLLVWSHVRRRQMLRRPRMDLGGEFVEPKARPPRSKSVNSEFMVQPPPIEKDAFGTDLSRTSTLVAPPPIAKDEKRSSEAKRNSARSKTLKLLLGADGLRSSILSSRSVPKQSSLIVPPLDIRKSQEDQVRISKF